MEGAKPRKDERVPLFECFAETEDPDNYTTKTLLQLQSGWKPCIDRLSIKNTAFIFNQA